MMVQQFHIIVSVQYQSVNVYQFVTNESPCVGESNQFL
jgi:hypothetical protein